MPGQEQSISVQTNTQATSDPSQPIVYQIRLKSHLDAVWTDWFEGLTVTLEENGHTLLTGPIVDQAALYRLLKKIRDLGALLISVNSIEVAASITLQGSQVEE